MYSGPMPGVGDFPRWTISAVFMPLCAHEKVSSPDYNCILNKLVVLYSPVHKVVLAL